MHFLKTSWLAWGLCAATAVATLSGLAGELTSGGGQKNWFNLAESLVFQLLALEFAFVAALILVRQPRNKVGWLLLGPASVALLSALVESAGADYNDLREGE